MGAVMAVMMGMLVCMTVPAIVVVMMMVVVRMPVIMTVRMVVMTVRIAVLERGLTAATTADGTHYSTSSSLTFISSPPTTCSW